MASTGEEFGLFWNSVNGDRTYDSDSFSKWLKKFFTTGVFNGDFQVVASSGMQINVKGGYANIAGKVYFMDNDKTLTLAVANSTYPRIDTIVITCDYINRKIFVENITGQLSGNSPVATAPVRNTEKYQIVLAQIRVNAGVTSITQTQITDTRTNNNLCGYIAGTVTQMNFAQFTAQFESYFTQFKNNNLESFNTWFNGIKEQLTDDVAGNLQSQIDSTNSNLTSKYNELKNASNINYSNTSSKLTATKVQGAIDEVVNKVNTANSNISAANSNISGLTTRVGALENGLSTTNSNISTANSNINSLKTRATNLETRATNLETKTTALENELTANGKRIYMDYHDGQYGYNTSASRGADTFVPFLSTIIPRGKSIILAPSANGVTYTYESIPALNTIGWTEASQYQGLHLCNPKDFKTIYIRWWKVIGFKNSEGSFTTIADVASNQWQTITVPDNTYNFLIISAYNNSLQEFKRTAQY